MLYQKPLCATPPAAFSCTTYIGDEMNKLFKALQKEFGNLNGICIDTMPLYFDFSQGFAETWDIAVLSYQDKCEECDGKGHIQCNECAADKPGRMVCDAGCKDGMIYDAAGNGTECNICDGDGYMDCNCKDEDYPEGRVECGKCDGEGEVVTEDPDRWSPMMHYIYPIKDEDFEPPDKPWDVLECTTLVDIKSMDGYALALTGSGMDFSWEICRSFVNLGYLPPVYFAKLPRMGRGESDQDKQLLRACLYSLMIKANWVEQSVESIIAENPEAYPEKETPHCLAACGVVGKEHLTVYVEPEYGDEMFCVDQDGPDDEDGTRNPGGQGLRYSSAKQAASLVKRWLKHQSPDFPNVPEGIFPTRGSGDFS